MILFYDTETTGLVNFKLPLHDPSQPRLVQLAMLVTDESGDEKFSFSALIEPDGWTVPDGMVHGISHEEAMRYGIPHSIALTMFYAVKESCNLIVGHNIKFDETVMQIAKIAGNSPIQDYNSPASFCTMLASTKLVGATQANGRAKWPKLSEAYKHFFGEELIGAHDAMTDLRATKRIYFHLKLGGPPTLDIHKNKNKHSNLNVSPRSTVIDDPRFIPNPDYKSAPLEIRVSEANTIHIGPPPTAIEPKQMWNGEEPVRPIIK